MQPRVTKTRIPRPRNCFIIFKYLNKDVVRDSFEKVNKRIPLAPEVCESASLLWRSLPDEEKRVYYELARVEKEEFMKRYPGYKFKKRKSEEIKRRKTNKVSL